jgi:hypothetical protein
MRWNKRWAGAWALDLVSGRRLLLEAAQKISKKEEQTTEEN